MVRVGILGAAGYTGGELLRILINHPEVEIVFANSESNAGNRICDVHEGLLGDTELCFTSEMPFDQVDVIFFCFGHGKSEAFLKEHEIPASVKIIDLAQDFRLAQADLKAGKEDTTTGGIKLSQWVYGLPEIHREAIRNCQYLANPGCFATCIQEGLLPLAKAGLLYNDIAVNAITGSTGAGQKPGATTHFSWRNDNFSVYKLFTHQHLHEITQTLNELRPEGTPRVVDTLNEGFNADGISVDFIPYRGDFARGIFCTEVVKLSQPADKEQIVALYKDFYKDEFFVRALDMKVLPDVKDVNGSNFIEVNGVYDKDTGLIKLFSAQDNLGKGAALQAIQAFNAMFGLDEGTGLINLVRGV